MKGSNLLNIHPNPYSSKQNPLEKPHPNSLTNTDAKNQIIRTLNYSRPPPQNFDVLSFGGNLVSKPNSAMNQDIYSNASDLSGLLKSAHPQSTEKVNESHIGNLL
jgi:hypothetical protein